MDDASPPQADPPPADARPAPPVPGGTPRGTPPWAPRAPAPPVPVGAPPGSGWPSASAAPPRSTPATSLAPTLIGSAITLGLTFVAAIVLVVAGDMSGDYFTSTGFQMSVAALVALAAPLALLVTWGEIDLSVIGATALGATLAATVSDGPDGAVVAGVLLAAFVGAFAGSLVGIVRWLTRAHSALVSLAAGVLLTGIAIQAGPGLQGRPTGRLAGSGLPILVAFVVTGAAVGLATLLRSGSADAATAGETTASGGAPGPRVIVGFALSGLGSAAAGALFASYAGIVAPRQTDFLLIFGFAAVAIAGVVRRSGLAGPLLAVPGALVVIMIDQATLAHSWREGESELILGIAMVLSVTIAWGLQRLLGSTSTPRPTGPAGPVGPYGGPPYGGPPYPGPYGGASPSWPTPTGTAPAWPPQPAPPPPPPPRP